jgi:hypothetical protein
MEKIWMQKFRKYREKLIIVTISKNNSILNKMMLARNQEFLYKKA